VFNHVCRTIIFLTMFILTSCSRPPELSNVSTSTLTLSSALNNTDSDTFRFSNTGEQPLEYTISADAPWISLSNRAGVLEPDNVASVTLFGRCQQLGTVKGNVSVKSNGGDSTIAVTLTCSAVPTSDFDIDLEFFGTGMTPARRQVFSDAAGLWSSVVIGDLQDISGTIGANQRCGFGEGAFSGVVDDLLILASIAPIDGKGKILGQAGPAYIRADTNDLTVIGCMQFDEADVADLEASGTFDEVILHEMGHVLGFGSLWEPSQGNNIDLLDQPCRSNPSAVAGFKGTGAVLEFGILGKTGNPPVENNGGGGTRCSHWDEDFFDNELMTGFLGGTTSQTVNPFSALTIGSMKDMGYDVDFSQAEPYSIPGCSPNCDPKTLKAADAYESWEIILQPKGTLDRNGKLNLFESR
jgi:hypothetical protein